MSCLCSDLPTASLLTPIRTKAYNALTDLALWYLWSTAALPLHFPALLQSHRPPSCSLNILNPLPPQGIYTCSYLCLNCSFPPIMSQLSPSFHSYFYLNITLSQRHSLNNNCLPFSQPLITGFIFLHTNSHPVTLQYCMFLFVYGLSQLEYDLCQGKVFVLFTALAPGLKTVPSLQYMLNEYLLNEWLKDTVENARK